MEPKARRWKSSIRLLLVALGLATIGSANAQKFPAYLRGYAGIQKLSSFDELIAAVKAEGGVVEQRPDHDVTIFKLTPADLLPMNSIVDRLCEVRLSNDPSEKDNPWAWRPNSRAFPGSRVPAATPGAKFVRPDGGPVVPFHTAVAAVFESIKEVVPPEYVPYTMSAGKETVTTCVTYRKGAIPEKPNDAFIVPIFAASARCNASLDSHAAKICFYAIMGPSRLLDLTTRTALGDPASSGSSSAEARRREAIQEVRARREAREQEEAKRVAFRLQEAEEFRKNIRVGSLTHCGPVVEMRADLVKIYNPVPSVGTEHWLYLGEVFPSGYPCEFKNGRHVAPEIPRSY